MDGPGGGRGLLERILDSGREAYDEVYRDHVGVLRARWSRVPWDAWASRISDVLAPVFVAILVWVPLSLRFSPSLAIALLNVAFAILFFLVVPLSVPFVYVKRGMDTLHVARRELRWLPMLVAVTGYATFWALEAFILKVPALATVLVVYFVTAIPFLLITLGWKISVHMSGNALSLMTLAAVWPWCWPLAVLHFPVGWARIRLKAHTPAQVLAGLAYGTACGFLAFRYFPLA